MIRLLAIVAVGLSLLQSPAAWAQQQAAPRRPTALPAWFTEIDTANTGVVTREQFIANRMTQFDKLDIDKDGMLTRAEFDKLAEPPFAPPAPTPALLAQRRSGYDAQFAAIDTNDDGKISRAEFQVSAALSFREYDIDGDGRATREEVLLLERMAEETREKARKERCRVNPDCNGDGVIDLEEFVAFETALIMDRLDPDKDGKVSLQTFLKLAGPTTNVQGQPPYQQRRDEFMRRFNEIDTDKSGVIDATKIRAWATTIFKRLDLDGDGRINPSEWELGNQPQTAATPPKPPAPPTSPTPPIKPPAPPAKPGAGPGPRPVAPPPPPPPPTSTGLQPGAPLK